MIGQDLPAHGGGVRGGGGDGRAIGPHHFPAEGLLLIAHLHHVHLAVQAQVGTGHGQGGAPLAGSSLGGHPFQALLLGIVGLGDGGVELVGTGGVVPLKLVVNLSRGLELLFQAVGPDQGGGAVHLVKVPNLLGDGDVSVVVVQLLLHQFLTEHALQLLGSHGLAGGRVEEGGGLVLHIGPDIVPCLGHLVLFQVNLIGDLFPCCHGHRLLSSIVPGIVPGQKQKRSCPMLVLQGQKRKQLLRCHPAWRHRRPLSALQQVPAHGNGVPDPSPLLEHLLVGLALPGPFHRAAPCRACTVRGSLKRAGSCVLFPFLGLCKRV